MLAAFWTTVLVAVLVGCGPAGPTPVRLTVPTAMVRSLPTRPTLTPSPRPSPTLFTVATTPVPVTQPPTPAQEPTRPPPPPLPPPIGGWSVSTLILGGRVTAPAAGPDSVLWVAAAGDGLGLYLRELMTEETRLLLGPSVPNGCVCRSRRAGDWVVATETLAGGLWWTVQALNLATNEWATVGRVEDPAVRDELWPGEADTDGQGRVVWKELDTQPDGSVVQILWLQDVVGDSVTEIARVASPTRIERVAMGGDWVVWAQATERAAGTRGDVFAYSVAGKQVFPIGETGRAWQPAVWGRYAVWKHADGPFADGDVFLFDLDSGQGEFLTTTGTVSAVGIGEGFVAWASMADGVVVLYDLETRELQTVGRGPIGWLHAAANVAVWQLDTEPNVLHVAWRMSKEGK